MQPARGLATEPARDRKWRTSARTWQYHQDEATGLLTFEESMGLTSRTMVWRRAKGLRPGPTALAGRPMYGASSQACGERHHGAAGRMYLVMNSRTGPWSGTSAGPHQAGPPGRLSTDEFEIVCCECGITRTWTTARSYPGSSGSADLTRWRRASPLMSSTPVAPQATRNWLAGPPPDL